MASYKVLQDIEAEDKLIGPLSLRQFIYAGIAVIAGFIAFKLAFVNLFLVIPFLPVMIFFGVLAVPFGHDQPSEVWLLAKVKFFIKPHVRLWNKDGAINLVTITAPKAINTHLTKDFSRVEAKSRLKALANTIDSRGWAIKDVNVNLNDQAPHNLTSDTTNRLIDPNALPQSVPQDDITAADDIMDPVSTQQLDQMISTATEEHKKKVIASVSAPSPTPDQTTTSPDYWFMNDATPPANGNIKFGGSELINANNQPKQVMSQAETPDDTKLLKEIEIKKRTSELANSHLHILQPLSSLSKRPVNTARRPRAPKVTPHSNPDIMNLALANKDNWSVATIASQAKKAKRKDTPPDEVVISLH